MEPWFASLGECKLVLTMDTDLQNPVSTVTDDHLLPIDPLAESTLPDHGFLSLDEFGLFPADAPSEPAPVAPSRVVLRSEAPAVGLQWTLEL